MGIAVVFTLAPPRFPLPPRPPAPPHTRSDASASDVREPGGREDPLLARVRRGGRDHALPPSSIPRGGTRPQFGCLALSLLLETWGAGGPIMSTVGRGLDPGVDLEQDFPRGRTPGRDLSASRRDGGVGAALVPRDEALLRGVDAGSGSVAGGGEAGSSGRDYVSETRGVSLSLRSRWGRVPPRL